MRDVEKAVDYLVSTDKEAAMARAMMLFIEDKKKTIKATEMVKKDGAISSREMEAYASAPYLEVCEEYKDAVYDYELLRNRRKSAELVVECWRTESANQRRGNV